jgi:L-alanine-DL-glutamate epimerase-like enolase superfamily enzyme
MPHNPLGPISTAANIQLGAAVPNYVRTPLLLELSLDA